MTFRRNGNKWFWSGPDSLYRNCNCNCAWLLHCWLTPLQQSNFLDPIMHPNNLFCTHLSASACGGEVTYKSISWSLLWKVGRVTKWHQTGIRYFYNLLTVPRVIQLWASWDFHHLSDSQISVTCAESAGLWFKYVCPKCRETGRVSCKLSRGTAGTRDTAVLFTQRVSALTYFSIP